MISIGAFYLWLVEEQCVSQLNNGGMDMGHFQTISYSGDCSVALDTFCQLWQRVTGKQLARKKYNGDIHLEVNKYEISSVEIKDNNQIVIRSSNEKKLFQSTMYFLETYGMNDTLVKNELVPKINHHQLLMIDIGRKFYSLTELKKFIDMMALFRFDFLQLHFSENSGFRIESEQYPEIVSSQHLTKKEVKLLIEYAKTRFIQIIPDIDTPGHMKNLLRIYPTWQLKQDSPTEEERTAAYALNLFDKNAVRYAYSIYKEYAELFQDSKYFHIGADEFVPFDELTHYPSLIQHAQNEYGQGASGIESFIAYVNQTAQFIQDLGFIPLVWSDGFYRKDRQEKLHLDKTCIVSYWTKWNKNMADISSYLDKGYKVINHNDNYLYYVLGENANYTYPTYEKIKKTWEPSLFSSHQRIDSEKLPQVWAVAVAIWADIPEAKAVNEIIADIFYLLSAVSQKAQGYEIDSKEHLDKLRDAFLDKMLRG